MALWTRLMTAGRAAYDAFRRAGVDAPGVDPRDLSDLDRYALKYGFWKGTWQYDPRIRTTALYRNTNELWRHAQAVVNLYTQFVYQGDLALDLTTLPDGTRGAIPIDPLTGQDRTDAEMLAAFGQLFRMWQFQQYKSLRPKMAAILGDCLTELVDDYARGAVLPVTREPWLLTDLQLDSVGNVKAYTLEYEVRVAGGDRYGVTVEDEVYQYRKEVDGDAFRYFKDDKPFPFQGPGTEVIGNPYGFVPAVWDRHEIVAGSDRGIGAFEKTLLQALQLNSVLSHAMDYQRKQFAAPVLIAGQVAMPRDGRLGAAPATEPQSEAQIEALRRELAERFDVLRMGEGAQLQTVTFDLGKTKEMLGLVMDAILAENPEARFGQEILTMTQVTAPGVMRALTPIVGLVNAAQDNLDPQTVKLLQMGTAIMGFRRNSGDLPGDLVRARPDRYDAFLPFGLDSYGRGLLDCSIAGRDMFQPSREERLQEVILLGQVIDSGDPYLMAQAGIPEDEIARIVGEREQRRAEMAAAFSVAGAGQAETEPPDNTTPGETPQPAQAVDEAAA